MIVHKVNDVNKNVLIFADDTAQNARDVLKGFHLRTWSEKPVIKYFTSHVSHAPFAEGSCPQARSSMCWTTASLSAKMTIFKLNKVCVRIKTIYMIP